MTRTGKERAVSVVFGGVGTVLVIRRFKSGRNYCVLPGGGVEDDEVPREAAVRELREEIGLAGEVQRQLWTLEHSDRIAHYYLVAVESGALRLGGPELETRSDSNRYSPEWVLLSEFDAENLQPQEIRPLLRSLSGNALVAR